MLTADSFIAAMRGYVGVAEIPDGSNLTTVGEKFGWNGVPWCAMTVSNAAQDVGFPLHEAAVGNIAAKAKAGWGGMRWTDTPQAGAIVCWDFGGVGNWNDMHTGVLKRVDLSKPLPLNTIEGNYSNRCDEWWRSTAHVMGYALLPFDQPPTFTKDELMDATTEAAIITTLSEIRDNLRKLIVPPKDGAPEIVENVRRIRQAQIDAAKS